MLPPSVRGDAADGARRFTAWTEAGVWRRLHRGGTRRMGSPRFAGAPTLVIAIPALRSPRGPRQRLPDELHAGGCERPTW
ncbi:hypothetical protein ACQPZ2_01960 [Nocardia pseudovaccinii]|uniref:hypothetical protein n=1 Tax=Nocardia pseudovaccinii TaxID=189540 RepID=UPI003D920C33